MERKLFRFIKTYVSPELHKLVKETAKAKGITMTKYLKKLLNEDLKDFKRKTD